MSRIKNDYLISTNLKLQRIIYLEICGAMLKNIFSQTNKLLLLKSNGIKRLMAIRYTLIT